MSKFNKDMRVVVIDEHNQVRKGVIVNVHDILEIAIVKFDDGNVEKVSFDYLGIEPETKSQGNQAVKVESQEGAKVITKDQFIEALNFVTTPEGMLGDQADEIDPITLMIKGMTVMCVGMRMSEKLFQDKEEIELTKDKLKDIIKDNCNPKEVAQSTGGKMSVADVFPISMLSALVLMKLVKILFSEGDNA